MKNRLGCIALAEFPNPNMEEFKLRENEWQVGLHCETSNNGANT